MPDNEPEASSDDFGAVFSRAMDGSASENDYELVSHAAARLVRLVAPSLSQADADDVVADVMFRMFRRGLRNPPREMAIESPYAYLKAAIRNAIADSYNRRMPMRTELMDLDNPDSQLVTSRLLIPDDDIARMIDAAARSELVQSALHLAVQKGDGTTFRVVTCFMNEAAREGKAPSNRAVAEALGLSHVGVGKSLKRFREYLLQTGLTPEDV